LKSINGAKFHIIISTVKYIIAIENKIQVIRKKKFSGSIFVFKDLSIPTQLLVTLIKKNNNKLLIKYS